MFIDTLQLGDMKNAINIIFLYSITLLLTLLPTVLIKFGLQGDVLPILPLIIVYFYATYHAAMLLIVFLYGIFVSECYGTPLGLESSLFVIFYFICYKYRVMLLSKQPISLFIGFCLVAFAYGILKYMTLYLYYYQWFDYKRALLQVITTILFYPLIGAILLRLKLRVD